MMKAQLRRFMIHAFDPFGYTTWPLVAACDDGEDLQREVKRLTEKNSTVLQIRDTATGWTTFYRRGAC